VGNYAVYGSAVFCRFESDPQVENCILAFNTGSGTSVYCMNNSNPILICCDVYGNDGGDWVGCIADQADLNFNFSLDPFFCDTDEGIYNISVISPCAPNNNNCEILIGSEEVIYCQKKAVMAIDKSGSMFFTDPLGQSRLERAKSMAHDEIDKLLASEDPTYPGIYQIAVINFNADGIILLQDFVSDSGLLHNTIDLITNPKHDTPLAAAMCQAHCLLGFDEEIARYVFTYTDGRENESQNFDMCTICAPCNYLMGTGWNFDCDPSNPSSCTEWQLCLNNHFTQSGINIVHYFGEPINPFDKSKTTGLEDMYFLKGAAEGSNGEFNYHSDQQTVCGDANSDGEVNISDAMYILNYAFINGPAPVLDEYGDVNCDDKVNVSDAVYIINYAFAGGYTPCDPDGDGEPGC